MFICPSHTSESAKKRKMSAQSRDNAMQPGPLSLIKRQKSNLLNQPYNHLQNREDRKEWILLALELRNSRKNYRGLELEVEELEEMIGDASDVDGDEATLRDDGPPQRGIGVSKAAKTYEQVKAPKSAKSSMTKGAPPPASPPGLVLSSSARKPSSAQPTAKVSKARVEELRNMQAIKACPATASHHTPTEVVGDRRPGPVPSKLAGSSQGRPQGTGGASEVRHHAPPNNPRRPAPEGARHPAPPEQSAHRPAPPDTTRRPAPTNGTSRVVKHPQSPTNGASRVVKHPPCPSNGERSKAPPAAQTATAGNDANNAEDTEDAEDTNGADDEDDETPQHDRPKKKSKRVDARLWDFGEATPIVALAMDMIWAKMAFEYLFPELIPAEDEPDANGSDDDDFTPVTKNLFHEWAEKCYDKAHRIVRRGKAPVLREDCHVTFMCYQLSQFRNQVKKVVEGKVPSVYGLIRGDPQSGVWATDLTTEDKFLSPNLVNDTDRFKHDIIRDIIQAAFFDCPRSLGGQYQHRLDVMPRETIAFVASIIQRIIKSYIRNDKASRTLAADLDHAEFDCYMGMMEEMTQTNQTTQLYNIQMRMLQPCLLSTERPAEMEHTPIQWEENDSEPDEELRHSLRAHKKKINEGKGKHARQPQLQAHLGCQADPNI
ncbi:hypothetical protein FRC06_011884 [Ceratobasidium sp. 370]|nr:hypothetical protein FRC06_011884 [Ceratobasidium sp. 370]